MIWCKFVQSANWPDPARGRILAVVKVQDATAMQGGVPHQGLPVWGRFRWGDRTLRGCLKRVRLVRGYAGEVCRVGRSLGAWNDLLIPATSATASGNCWNRCCHRPNRAVDPSPTPGGRSSTPSATYCALAAPGLPEADCLMTCHPGASSSITSAPGVVMAPGNEPMTHCMLRCDRLRAERPTPVRLS